MFKLAEGLDLPADAATQVYAFMGRRGSGKTYGVGRLVEQLLDRNVQVVVVDPVGTWGRGLRLAADGRSPGFDIAIFGGLHGDLPLEATAGPVVAELVAGRRVSLVLDVSSFTGADQRKFVGDFARELFHRKKQHRSAMMVVLEEAQEFAPQHVRGDHAAMVGAVEKLVKLGRNFGIGTCMISQRPQAVNKDILNQTEVMFAFQLTGPQERKAIEGWVQEVGAAGRDKVGLELPGLPVGTAIVWSPQWLRIYGQYRILPKKTFDASATPKAGQADSAAAPRKLEAGDLEAIREAMAATIEHAKENDPKELRAEVARLKKELAAGGGAEVERWKREANTWAETVEEMRQEVTRLRRIEDAVAGMMAALKGTGHGIDAIGAPPERRPGRVIDAGRPADWAKRPTNGHAPAAPAFGGSLERPRPRPRGDGESGALPAGAREMLYALAHYSPLTKRQLATLAGFAPGVSTVRNYLSILRGQQLITADDDGSFHLTGKGKEAARDAPPAKSISDRVSKWREVLPGKAREIFDLFAVEHGPFTKAQIAKRLDIPTNVSTLRNYWSLLVSNGLIHKTRTGYLIVPELAL